MSKYFPEQKFSGVRVKVDLDLSNYAAKADLKNATGVNTSKFAKKSWFSYVKIYVDKSCIDKLKNVPTNLSSLKSRVSKLAIDKLMSLPVDLTKLGDVVKNNVVKTDV